jgi:hypothetical protein
VRAATGRGFTPGGANGGRRWLGRKRVRTRDGRGWLISAWEVSWGRWGHAGATCTRGKAGAWPVMCAAPAANGAPRAVRRPADQRHLAQPLATDGTSECSPALRSDQRSNRRLGVRTRSGYGAYGGWPTWPRTTSRPNASQRFRCCWYFNEQFSK